LVIFILFFRFFPFFIHLARGALELALLRPGPGRVWFLRVFDSFMFAVEVCARRFLATSLRFLSPLKVPPHVRIPNFPSFLATSSLPRTGLFGEIRPRPRAPSFSKFPKEKALDFPLRLLAVFSPLFPFCSRFSYLTDIGAFVILPGEPVPFSPFWNSRFILMLP